MNHNKGTTVFDATMYCGIGNLDPAEAATDCHIILLNQIFDTLFEIDSETLDIKPLLVERYHYDREKYEYQFKLRDNIYFHDGRPIDAKDVAYSLHRMLQPQRSANYTKLFAIKGASAYASGKSSSIEGLRILSDKSFSLTLTQASPFLLYNLTSVKGKYDQAYLL